MTRIESREAAKLEIALCGQIIEMLGRHCDNIDEHEHFCEIRDILFSTIELAKDDLFLLDFED